MKRIHSRHQRRGTVATMVIVSMPVVIGFATLAIDVGQLCNTKAELQRAADAAALAGASAYLTDAGLKDDHSTITSLATSRAQATSKVNPTLKASTLLAASDVAVGKHDTDNPKGTLSNGNRWNAAEATVRRTAGGLNGAVPFFFAGFFGMHQGSSTAHARAAVDDHFAGYNLNKDTHALIPFTINTTLYDEMVASGPDSYSYNGSVQSSSDQIHEVRLFPWRQDTIKGQHGQDSSGNFGTLNVGVGNQGTSTLESQIKNGIPAADMVNEFGTSDLRFYNSNGSSHTYGGTGNPGMSTGIKDIVAARVGDVVGFFVHTSYSGTGSNLTYQISGIRFGRIMHVDITGSPDARTITIQPVAYTDGNVEVDPKPPSTNGQVVRIFLVQ